MTAETEVRHSAVMSAAWAQCDLFNAAHRVGTKVQYRSLRDQASQWDINESVTRSPAWALPNGEAVVLIAGKAGGVSLDHIEVVG